MYTSYGRNLSSNNEKLKLQFPLNDCKTKQKVIKSNLHLIFWEQRIVMN